MSKEAMKLALEALENMTKIRDCQREKGYPLSDADKRMQTAIKAIEEALAKQEHEWAQGECVKCGASIEQEQGEPLPDFYITEKMADSIYKLKSPTWSLCISGNKAPTMHRTIPVFVGYVKTKLVEQEQSEPMDWSDEQLKMLNFLYGAGDFDGVWFEQKHPTEKGAFWWRKHMKRLFDTTPQQRTWVGLTDEEMHECAGEYPWTPTGLKCVRAIEAKLKEKNT